MSFRSRLKKELDASVWSNPQTADTEPARPVEGAHPTKKIEGLCTCGECVQFGVDQEPRRRVPNENGDGGSRLIHGQELRRYLDAQARTMADLRARFTKPTSSTEIHGGES